ncbi:hypothetical protein [Actinopolyspora erythraea]|uniref:hypothetical protein n=1 Tax=Actinopolyspora erythraea TaxID=414996 RepID=UPI0018DF4E4D|nr:hypothetical protein [Actinopolyspora erythraea]
MSRPTAISPEEQEQIARRIGVLLLQEAPEDWQQITVEYRATGEYHDLLAEVTSQDGASRPWEPPEELNGIFGHLREGMYRPDVGTWLSALYTVERPSSYRIDINFDEEPQWPQPLPAEAYVEELNRYPRSEDNIPEWMSARLGRAPETGAAADEREVPPSTAEHPAPPPPAASAADPGEEPGERPDLAVARVFDDEDEQGRPLVHGRPPLAPQESEPLRRYLENAPIVLAAEYNTPDRLDPNRSEAIPDSWHSDGSWVWPTAVPYYLSQYGVPPQPELLQHIRSNGFNVADLDPAVREAAEEAARAAEEAEEEREFDTAEQRPDEQAQRWQDADDRPTATTEAVAAAPANDPVPSEVYFDEQPVHGEGAGLYDHPVLEEQHTGASVAPVPEPPAEETPFDSGDSLERRNDEAGPDHEEHAEQRWETSSPGEAVTATRHGLGDELEEDPEIIFGQFRQRLDELGLDTNDYRLGGRSESVWSLFDEAADWVVSPPDGDGEPMRFARPEQACAYLLGSLLLNETGEERIAAPPEPELRSAPEEPISEPREEQLLADSQSDSEDLLPTGEAPSEPSTDPEPEPQRTDASPIGTFPDALRARRRGAPCPGGQLPVHRHRGTPGARRARLGSFRGGPRGRVRSGPGRCDTATTRTGGVPIRTGKHPSSRTTRGHSPPGQMPHRCRNARALRAARAARSRTAAGRPGTGGTGRATRAAAATGGATAGSATGGRCAAAAGHAGPGGAAPRSGSPGRGSSASRSAESAGEATAAGCPGWTDGSTRTGSARARTAARPGTQRVRAGRATAGTSERPSPGWTAPGRSHRHGPTRSSRHGPAHPAAAR